MPPMVFDDEVVALITGLRMAEHANGSEAATRALVKLPRVRGHGRPSLGPFPDCGDVRDFQLPDHLHGAVNRLRGCNGDAREE